MAALEIPRLNCSDVNETDNETLDEYLVRVLGPKHLPLAVVLPITIIYVFIFVSGIIGNIAVCAVIARNKSMRTATNYYLFSLAVSDLTLLLLGLPYDLSVYWQQYPSVLGETVCKLRALGSEMSSYTSVLTIVAFSTERYLAICQPIHSYTTSSPQIAVRVIAVLWLISLVSATPFAVYTRINYVVYPAGSKRLEPESAFCAMLDDPEPIHWPMLLSAFLFFLGPMLIIMVLYVRMGTTIRSRTLKFPGETKHLDSRTKPIIRMLAAVVVTFFLCWAPFHMQRLFYIYGKDSPNFDKINEWAYYITGCFYFFSCTVNPVLYNVMSAKYRLAFRKTLCCLSRGNSVTREASTFRDTTVVYVNSHLERCRSINNHGEVRRLRSINRYSKNTDVPNNMMEKETHSNLWRNSSSFKEHGEDQKSSKSCDKLLEPYDRGEKIIKCHQSSDISNQVAHNNEVSDIIVMVNPSTNGKSNSYTKSNTFSKALLKVSKKSTTEDQIDSIKNQEICDVKEPCLKENIDRRQLSIKQEEMETCI